MVSTLVPRNGVPSPRFPVSAQTLPSKHSINWPMVMREGRAKLLMTMSGEIP